MSSVALRLLNLYQSIHPDISTTSPRRVITKVCLHFFNVFTFLVIFLKFCVTGKPFCPEVLKPVLNRSCLLLVTKCQVQIFHSNLNKSKSRLNNTLHCLLTYIIYILFEIFFSLCKVSKSWPYFNISSPNPAHIFDGGIF